MALEENHLWGPFTSENDFMSRNLAEPIVWRSLSKVLVKLSKGPPPVAAEPFESFTKTFERLRHTPYSQPQIISFCFNLSEPERILDFFFSMGRWSCFFAVGVRRK
jgi:hypothetical protein